MNMNPVPEMSWIAKLKNIFGEQFQHINEEMNGDEQINGLISRDASESSIDQSNDYGRNNNYQQSSSSLDQEGLRKDVENKRNIYLKVANAFLEQSLTENEDVFLINKHSYVKQIKLQKSIIQENYKEFETDFQLNKLNEDNNPALDVIEMSVFDRINLFQAHTLFEKAYKQIWFTKEIISNTAYRIVNHSIFTVISLGVIAFNSIMLAQDDPTTNSDNNPTIDFSLLVIYSTEMVLKILAYGFLFGKNAYLQDAWNVVDLVIVITGYLPYVLNSNSVNLSALRSLRVLRPLRSVNKVKSLNQLLTALFSAIPLLKDVLIILGFFFAIFGIAGLQLFTGQLKTRCYDAITGIYLGDEGQNLFLCSSDSDCPVAANIQYICSKGMVSPNYDFYNFDTFGWSVLNVYIVVSNEGWSTIMRDIQIGFSVNISFFKYISTLET